MVGCITGRPVPEMDLYGYRDVQIWNVDVNGRLNGDPGFNRKDPLCFCFDCRGCFDEDGTVDAELVNSGHKRASFVYASLLHNSVPVTNPSGEVKSMPSVPRSTSSHGINPPTLFPTEMPTTN